MANAQAPVSTSGKYHDPQITSRNVGNISPTAIRITLGTMEATIEGDESLFRDIVRAAQKMQAVKYRRFGTASFTYQNGKLRTVEEKYSELITDDGKVAGLQ